MEPAVEGLSAGVGELWPEPRAHGWSKKSRRREVESHDGARIRERRAAPLHRRGISSNGGDGNPRLRRTRRARPRGRPGNEPQELGSCDPVEVHYDRLRDALRGRASVYFEAPLTAVQLDSEPEPDVLVCSNPEEWAYRSPRTKPLLEIEAADSSLEFDRGEKACLYAEAGVPEYWVVNLVDRVLMVFREPLKGR